VVALLQCTFDGRSMV